MITDRRLDRLQQFDEKSRNFPATAGLEDNFFRSYTWSCGVYNDQGREGACVGFAWSHELSAKPKIIATDDAFAQRVYKRAQQLDPWPGEDYSGTSVLAGAKAVQELVNSRGKALIREYRWAFGIQDVLKVVAYRGPIVLGIDWYTGMYKPDENNMIYAAGELAGGHAIMANGVKLVRRAGTSGYPMRWEDIDPDKSLVRLHNSWGVNYGLGGNAFITVTDLNKLLQDGGDACIPTVRSVA